MIVTSGKLFQLFLLGILLFLQCTTSRAAALEAHWVLYNGKILTADTEDPGSFTIVQAVAIYDGKFVVVGSNQEALDTAGPTTRRVDLAGKTVLPGFIETHLHVHTQALSHHARGVVDIEPSLVSWSSKEQGLAQVRSLAVQKRPGEWVVAVVVGRGRLDGMVLGMSIANGNPLTPTLAELDAMVPDCPLYLMLGNEEPALVNSQALDLLLARYPNGYPTIVRDEEGNPTGVLKGPAARLIGEFLPEWTPEEVRKLAPLFRKELEEPAARGLTSVATRVDNDSMRVYQLLDEQGEMPVRLSYVSEFAQNSPITEVLFRRVPMRAGHGTPWLWSSGATVGNIEGTTGPQIGAACIHGTYPRESSMFPAWLQQPWGPHGDCKLTGDPNNTVLRDFLLSAARFGWAVSNIHANGDRSLDDYMDVLEEAENRYSIRAADLRFSLDHCGHLTEPQAQRAQRLGISFTCTPVSFDNAESEVMGAYAVIYDRDRAADAYSPFHRLVSLGMKPSIHCEGHQDWPFTCLQWAITRKDKATGQVWGPQQRIDRRAALYTYTRWAAWHVWKEDNIGSIEPGKWADLVVIDRDYLTTPEDELALINPLLTIVGGEVRYSEPNYAASEGLPTVGFQAPPDWWER